MFDDFGVMARELAEQHKADLSSVENVHLYKTHILIYNIFKNISNLHIF